MTLDNSLLKISTTGERAYSSVSSEINTLADFRLVNFLLSKPRYNIPEHLRDKAIKAVEKLLDREFVKDSTRVQAIRTLALMDKINVEIVKLSMPKKIEKTDPKKLTDEELVEKLRNFADLLKSQDGES